MHIVTDVRQANHMINKYNFCISLMCFSRNYGQTYCDVESLFQQTRLMEWIALLPPAYLESVDLCMLITKNLYTYHTLPLDPTGLLAG